MPKMKFRLNVFGTYLRKMKKIGENKPRQWKAPQKNRFVLNRSQLQKTEETVGTIRRSESNPGHWTPVSFPPLSSSFSFAVLYTRWITGLVFPFWRFRFRRQRSLRHPLLNSNRGRVAPLSTHVANNYSSFGYKVCCPARHNSRLNWAPERCCPWASKQFSGFHSLSGAISSLSASPRSIARSLARLPLFRLCLWFLYFRSRSSYGVEVLTRKIGKRSRHHYYYFSFVFSAFCIPSRRDKVKFARSCYYFPRSLFISLFLFGTLSVCSSSSSS
jgi:hypothetical protein